MSKKHNWDILEDMVVCSHILNGDISNKKIIKKICKEFGLTTNQLSARVKNFENIMGLRKSFFNTCRKERKAYELLMKHGTMILI